MAARFLLPLFSLGLQAEGLGKAGNLTELDRKSARVRSALALAEAPGSLEYDDSRLRAAMKLLLLKIGKDRKYAKSLNSNFKEELLLKGERKQKGNTWGNNNGPKKKKPKRKNKKQPKKKTKPPKKKKPNQKRGGHPRNKLAFDNSCQCGEAPKPQRHGGLWVSLLEI